MKFKRRECAILPLVLKGKWYDMIASGEKREEYRLAKGYWDKRIWNWDCATTEKRPGVVEFRRGYAANAPRMAFWVFGHATGYGMRTYCHVAAGQPRHPEWGEPEEEHFTIRLGGRVEFIDDENRRAR